jgi:phosphoribosylglycinamide formyltransferase 1
LSDDDLRFALVVSTSGSVMNEVLKNEFFRSRVQLVVTDHEGTAHDHAVAHGVNVHAIPESDADRFCQSLLSLCSRYGIDYVFSFYTQFFSPEFRAAYRDRVLNFHPSLLPAFKGLDGFEATIEYPARFAGNTVELIAEVMDEGKIVMQTTCPVDPTTSTERTRHRVFVQQCQALIQTAHWLQEGRITTEGRRVVVAGARFDDPSFSPALDSDDARGWLPPNPYADQP